MLHNPLFSPAFFRQIRQKCDEAEWARLALQKLKEQAEARWKQPIDIPLLGGGWSHDYNCPDEGDRLVPIDRHHHRCPTCGRVWSGSPWDEVAVTHEHGYYSTGAKHMALLFGITGDERAASWAKRVLLFYAAHYEDYALHDRFGGTSRVGGKVMCQTLSESSWLLPIAQAYCILKLHGMLSAEEREAIEHNLLLRVVPLLDGNPMGISNWQSYHNAAKAWIAAATGREDLLDQAVEDPANGFRFQMEHSLSDDGFWYEGAWGYHFYTLTAQVQLVLAAQFMGVTLHEHGRFQSMFRSPLQCMFPDGTLPPVHDSVTVQVRHHAPLYEYASGFFGVGLEVIAASSRDSAEALLFGPADASGGRKEQAGSPALVELKKAGMIFMKQPASRQTAMIDYGMHGGYHGHRDKLSLLYYAGGHPWLSDAGMLPYGNAMHEAFFKQTAAHNTVTLGGRSQAEAEGRVVQAERMDNGWIRLETVTDEAYAGAVLRRLNVLTDKLLVDVFEVSCEQEQDVDWILHTKGLPVPVLRPSDDMAADGDPEFRIGSSDGYEYMEPVARWNPENGKFWCRTWAWDDAAFSGDRFEAYGLIPQGESEELMLATSPAMPSIGKHSTLIRRRRSVRSTRFITVLRACREGEGRLLVELADDRTIQLTFPDSSIELVTWE
ncbi:hypothetical protein PAESOLCIP111_00246 [Paenibacillus solanacearum]|uniref:Alginate lyase domain-containing protein n=1 Tax=Paenibacillus solanacearum TaxID=2048548 RepID=A0A916JS34_9BACL|nr:heparinase II/III family protein [Paenibacillus solanacearum]CAG7598664.1 hypothetical protein PAESOLCIP111_00246 [Paenibacillus solanacearum]